MAYSMNLPNRLLYTVGISVTVTAVVGATYWVYKNLKRFDIMPEKWRRVGVLKEIHFFPIKSCAPLVLSPTDEIACEVLGLRLDGFRDRSLMILDNNNQMVTARTYPKMVTIGTKKIGPTKMLISGLGMPNMELDFATLVNEAPGLDVNTAVWGVKVTAMLCGEKYDQWFSRFILDKDTGMKLVYYPYEIPVRANNPRLKSEPYIQQEDSGTFGDATSYMLMNLSSVDDLNTRLTNKVDPLQFRGNFHLQMDVNEPYAEDNWNWIRIGSTAVFRIVAPCTRCILPNINCRTGERDPAGNPLVMLKTYRMLKNYASPALGVHLGIRQNGIIKANDIIYVEDK